MLQGQIINVYLPDIVVLSKSSVAVPAHLLLMPSQAKVSRGKFLGRPLDNFPEIFRRIGHVILRRRRQPHFRDYSTPSHKLNVERLALWSEVPFDESTGALLE